MPSMPFRSSEVALRSRFDALDADVRERDEEIASLRTRLSQRPDAELPYKRLIVGLVIAAALLAVVAAWAWRPTPPPSAV